MNSKVPQPIFTLRGHNVGVTALTYCTIFNCPYLVSGDEEGSICIWDLAVFRKLTFYSKVAKSRIQSLKAIKLNICDEIHDVIFIHSRNNGILLLDLSKSINESELSILVNYDSVDSLFSRGDAINEPDNTAILSYPSCLENHLITVRIVGKDASTLISGTASRNNEARDCPLFDIALKRNSQQSYLLFAAFEDGCLYVFSFSPSSTKTVPHLNCTGLDVRQIRKFDFKIGDFISAFDIKLNQNNNLFAVVGSPLKQIIFLSVSLDQESDIQEPIYSPLKRQGVSAIAIRPDQRLVAVACWDSSVKLYSLKSFKILACVKHHLKQVSCILFYEQLDQQNSHDHVNDQEARETSDKKYLMCCASMEGTISISAIY